MLTEVEVRSGDETWKLNADPESWVGSRIIEGKGRPYEWQMLEYIRKTAAAPGMVAVDVGAHIGNHSLFFSEACGMHVEAFEPIFFEELRANISLNDASIEVHPVALGEDVGHARDSGERVMTNEPRAGIGEGRLTPGVGPIPVHPLDEFELRDVRLIKIDVEGMEPEVLRGAEATILRCRPFIYAEAETRAAHNRLEEVLRPWGYKMCSRFKRGTPREEWRPSR